MGHILYNAVVLLRWNMLECWFGNAYRKTLSHVPIFSYLLAIQLQIHICRNSYVVRVIFIRSLVRMPLCDVCTLVALQCRLIQYSIS